MDKMYEDNIRCLKTVKEFCLECSQDRKEMLETFVTTEHKAELNGMIYAFDRVAELCNILIITREEM